MSIVKVEGYSNFVKDTDNGGVLNTDSSAYNAYKRQKFLANRSATIQKESSESIRNLETELNNLRQDLTDMKTMLFELLQKR